MANRARYAIVTTFDAQARKPAKAFTRAAYTKHRRQWFDSDIYIP